MTQLSAPTEVTSKASDDGTKVTISWKDPNPIDSVASYDISFVAKDKSTTAFTGTSAQNAPATSVDIARQPTDKPSAADLVSKYKAQVVAKPKNTTDTGSNPGVQGDLHWEISPSITIKFGDVGSLTLTKSSNISGKYSLPVSKADPAKIKWDDIKALAKSVSLDVVLPDKWPVFGGELDVSKLAVNTDLGLFELDITIPNAGFNPILGLEIESLGLNVLRTDGVTVL
jgi:hypothetical protein